MKKLSIVEINKVAEPTMRLDGQGSTILGRALIREADHVTVTDGVKV